MRQGQQPSSFFEIELLKPYLAAYEARRLEIAHEQAEYDLAHPIRLQRVHPNVVLNVGWVRDGKLKVVHSPE
jgi:hypothetical protein